MYEFFDDKDGSRMRLAEALERALLEADGLVTIKIANENTSEEFILSAQFACKNDGFSFPEVEPRFFLLILLMELVLLVMVSVQNILWVMSRAMIVMARVFVKKR